MGKILTSLEKRFAKGLIKGYAPQVGVANTITAAWSVANLDTGPIFVEGSNYKMVTNRAIVKQMSMDKTR